MRAARPDAKVIILSMYPEEQHAALMLSAGAAAYVSKARPPEQLLLEIRRVAAGAAPTPLEEVEPPRQPHHFLSAREHQVFMLLVEGHSVAEIAAQLNIVSSTVSNHINGIRDKLSVRTVADIVSYAHRAGLVD